jgi:hypothetical protein
MKVDWRGVFPAATAQFARDRSVDLSAGRQLQGATQTRPGL